jgi:4-carboxymuconolactone decarboxylase
MNKGFREQITPGSGLPGRNLCRYRRHIMCGFVTQTTSAQRSERTFKEKSMEPQPPQPPVRGLLGDFAPKLSELTQQVLFGDIWERPGLSKRDRSLVTVATLVALNRTEQLRFHLGRALENGVTKDELIELITHLAFYSGWPTAMSAILLAKEMFEPTK